MMISISKNRICRKVFMLICFSLTIFLTGCGSSVDLHETEAEQNIPEDSYEIKKEKMGEENYEADEETAEENSIIPYNVPLDEIVERIEYLYAYENMIYDISSYEFDGLGVLPQGENVQLSIYAAEGNRLLFLPKEKENAEIIVNGEICGGHYSQQYKGYLFYCIGDWSMVAYGFPLNAVASEGGKTISECLVSDESIHGEAPKYYGYNPVLKDMVKLGEVTVSFDSSKKIDLPAVPVEGNEYINSVVQSAAATLRGKGQYGDFKMYIETYGRLNGKARKDTSCGISGCIVGEEVAQYFIFEILDGYGRMEVSRRFAPFSEDDPMYFSGSDMLYGRPDDLVQRIIDLGRESIPFRVTENKTSGPSEPSERADYYYAKDIDFCSMTAEEAASLLTYVCSYSEWFGMNELGYVTGKLRGLKDKKIIMYASMRELYFVPEDKVNYSVEGKNGETYPLYVNDKGEAEYYMITEIPNTDKEAQLITSLPEKTEWATKGKYSACEFTLIGEGMLNFEDLSTLVIPKIDDDEYISALQDHIKDLLEQSGKEGKYEIYIGEYEAFPIDKVCISAAVVGEEEYYVRYLIVRSQKGNYYFWPAGFGLDGSLEECEAGRHYMNRLCIERTKKLERHVSVIGVSQNDEEKGSEERKENPAGIFADGNVIDLGGHIVTYCAPLEGEVAREYKETEYFVIQDLDEGDALYLPNDFGEILDINIADNSKVYIKYADNGAEGEIVIPIRFSNRGKEAAEIFSIPEKEKIIYGTHLKEPLQPKEVWNESIMIGEKKCRITFERTSPPYHAIYSVIRSKLADYLLTIRDEEENVLWEQAIINYPIQYEEVYWIKDISNDGFLDIIFCTEYESMPHPYTSLRFLVWNTEEEIYELKDDPYYHMAGPVWDEEISVLMFYKEGFNHWAYDWEIYTFDEGDWKLCVKAIMDSENKDIPFFEEYYQEEMYYKGLDYYIKEIYYEDGKAVEENIVDSWEDSVWKYRSKNGEQLYPGEWILEEITLSTGETVNKYLRE